MTDPTLIDPGTTTILRVAQSEEGFHFEIPNPDKLEASQLMALIGGLIGTCHVDAASEGLYAALSEQMVDQSLAIAKEGAMHVMDTHASGKTKVGRLSS